MTLIVDILPFPFLSYIDMNFEPTISFSKGLELFINVRKSYKTAGNQISEEYRETETTASATRRN